MSNEYIYKMICGSGSTIFSLLLDTSTNTFTISYRRNWMGDGSASVITGSGTFEKDNYYYLMNFDELIVNNTSYNLFTLDNKKIKSYHHEIQLVILPNLKKVSFNRNYKEMLGLMGGGMGIYDSILTFYHNEYTLPYTNEPNTKAITNFFEFLENVKLVNKKTYDENDERDDDY